MIAKTISCVALFIGLNMNFAWIAFAIDPPAAMIGPGSSLDQMQQRIDSLRVQGKNDEADRLEIERGQAIKRLYGPATASGLEIHEDLPAFPPSQPSDMTLTNDVPRVARRPEESANIPKPQRLRSLLAAAASLKAAGLNDDAARYERMASQLAQEGSSREVEQLRAEVMECRKQIEQLRAELQSLWAKVERPVPMGTNNPRLTKPASPDTENRPESSIPLQPPKPKR
jgi:hypothetical protein